MLSGLEVEYFAEEESAATTPRGKTKHWLSSMWSSESAERLRIEARAGSLPRRSA